MKESIWNRVDCVHNNEREYHGHCEAKSTLFGSPVLCNHDGTEEAEKFCTEFERDKAACP